MTVWRMSIACWIPRATKTHSEYVDCVRNVMAHLNRWGRQFSRLLAAEVCASAVVILDTPCSEVVWRLLATHSIRQFPLHFPSRASPCAITFQLDSNTYCVSPATVVAARRSLVSSITVDWFLAPRIWGFYLKSKSTNYRDYGHYGDPPPTRKIPMVEPGIEPGTSWLVVRSSDH